MCVRFGFYVVLVIMGDDALVILLYMDRGMENRLWRISKNKSKRCVMAVYLNLN